MYQDVKYITNGTAIKAKVVMAGKVRTRTGKERMTASRRAPAAREHRAKQRDRPPQGQEQRNEQDQHDRLDRPGVEQHRLVDAHPGHRGEGQEAEAEPAEPDRPGHRPAPGPPGAGQVGAAQDQDERQHPRVESPLRQRPGQGWRRGPLIPGGAVISGDESVGQPGRVQDSHACHATDRPGLDSPRGPTWLPVISRSVRHCRIMNHTGNTYCYLTLMFTQKRSHVSMPDQKSDVSQNTRRSHGPRKH